MENTEKAPVNMHKEEQKASKVEVPLKSDVAVLQEIKLREGEASAQAGLCDEEKSDAADISERETDVCLEETGYDQRIILALRVCDYLNENEENIFPQLNNQIFYEKLPFMKEFKYQDIPSFVSDSNNYLLAYLLFYIMSGGKYPQDVWKNAFADYDKTPMGRFECEAGNMIRVVKDIRGRGVASELEKTVDKILREQKRENIQAAMGNLNGVGSAKIFELIWLVFTKNYGSFNIGYWEDTLKKFRSKSFLVREASRKETCDRAQLFAVSYEGRLDKPGHNGCEDYSLIKKYDEDNWFVAVADGVGSCIHSALGSKEATLCLSKCIETFLTNHKLIVDKKRAFGYKKISDSEYADLMYYIKFLLVNDFYKEWEEAIRNSQEFKRTEDVDVSAFSTTLQFAFGCAKFIVCGALGDGSFYVKKRRATNTGASGGFLLNDGISGVLRHEVLTVPHLKNDSTALQLSFFGFHEVSDIFISSDGVTNAVGETVGSVDAFVQDISELSFDERCQKLEQIAQKCSDYNETNFGSGDDSSIAYVHIR